MASKKIAIVTGGNRGIGREIARQLMKAEVFVVVGCRSEPKCAMTVDDLKSEGSNIAGFPLDVNDTKSVRRFVEHVEKHHGSPGVLVNNAGVYPEETDAKVVDTPATAASNRQLRLMVDGASRQEPAYSADPTVSPS